MSITRKAYPKSTNPLGILVLSYVQLAQAWERLPSTTLSGGHVVTFECIQDSYNSSYNTSCIPGPNRRPARASKRQIEKKIASAQPRSPVSPATQAVSYHYTMRTLQDVPKDAISYIFLIELATAAVKRSVFDRHPLEGGDATGHVVTGRCPVASLALDRAS